MNDITSIIKPKYALKHLLVPLDWGHESVRIAFSKKPVRELLGELQFIFKRPVHYEIWEESHILREIHKRYRIDDKKIDHTRDEKYTFVDKILEKKVESDHLTIRNEYIIEFVDQMISRAINKKASDIHVELYENQIRIRFRIDGKLQEQEIPPFSKKMEIVSRLKIMAQMDIAEKRRPQDGRIRMRNRHNHQVDIRASTLPSEFGERVVLRLLDKSALKLSLESLGFSKKDLLKCKKNLQLPYGMILVTGPTGSGKTTTLYAGLNFINSPEVNIITVEDPIEYHLSGINQTQVKPEIGLTFASILRTILRQDPNIIMVGEIRDKETAEIAIRSAQTGHLVLSTLHTNDALSSITRLIDMGIEPFLIANSLKLVMAQRLIRRICPKCKQVDENMMDPPLLSEDQIPLTAKKLYKGIGCISCDYSGYQGREAVIELIEIDDTFSSLITKRAGSDEMRNLIETRGFIGLHAAALEKARKGITSIDEVMAETRYH